MQKSSPIFPWLHPASGSANPSIRGSRRRVALIRGRWFMSTAGTLSSICSGGGTAQPRWGCILPHGRRRHHRGWGRWWGAVKPPHPHGWRRRWWRGRRRITPHVVPVMRWPPCRSPWPCPCTDRQGYDSHHACNQGPLPQRAAQDGKDRREIMRFHTSMTHCQLGSSREISGHKMTV